MDILFTIILLLFAVAISTTAVKLIPIKIPAPLLQLLFGIFLGSPLFDINITLDPAVFLFLFIPPLLFTDGWRFPKKEFYYLKRPILALAVGLVFFTILGVGLFIHWMIPLLALPMAFALAAVLSPTDAVAVNAIVGHGNMPSKLRLVLEGEALLNDASGLVAFKFALIAGITGIFSFTDVASQFLLVSLGGFVIGAFVAWAMCALHHQIAKISHDEPGIQVVVLLLIPFMAYLLAEHLHLSGVLAAVGAGMAMTYAQNATKTSTAARLLGNSIWTMLEFVLNGLAFILLGLQLPNIWESVRAEQLAAGDLNFASLIGVIFAIYGVMMLLRFVWVYIANQIKNQDFTTKPPLPKMLVLLVTTFAGVRGAITLAAILAIPIVTKAGDPFPQRHLLILIASGVIVISLVVSSIILPLLVKRFQAVAHDPLDLEIADANKHLANVAIEAIRRKQTELQSDIEKSHEQAILDQVADNLVSFYEQEISLNDSEHGEEHISAWAHDFESKLHLSAIRAERRVLDKMHTQHTISETTFRKLLRDMDLRETLTESRNRKRLFD